MVFFESFEMEKPAFSDIIPPCSCKSCSAPAPVSSEPHVLVTVPAPVCSEPRVAVVVNRVKR